MCEDPELISPSLMASFGSCPGWDSAHSPGAQQTIESGRPFTSVHFPDILRLMCQADPVHKGRATQPILGKQMTQ